MEKIIESIPNISEGRNEEIIEACVDTIRSTPGCTLLDYSSDSSHNGHARFSLPNTGRCCLVPPITAILK